MNLPELDYRGNANYQKSQKKRRSKKDGKMKYGNSNQYMGSKQRRLKIHSVEDLLLEAEQIRAEYRPIEDRVNLSWKKYDKGNFVTDYSSYERIEASLRKMHGFWVCKLSLGEFILEGKGRSKQSALWTLWNTYAAEIARCYYNIPHKLNWGNLDGEIEPDYASDVEEYVPPKFVPKPTGIVSENAQKANQIMHQRSYEKRPAPKLRGIGLTKEESEKDLPKAEIDRILAERKTAWIKTL